MRASLKALLTAIVLVLVGRRGKHLPPAERERIVPVVPPDQRSELVVAALLMLASIGALAFVVIYALDALGHQTQLLGLALGGSLLSAAAALILTAKRLVANEELAEGYPQPEHPDEQARIVQTIEESGDGITRRRLLAVCAGLSGGSLALALATPVASLGPVANMESLYRTPWRRGRRLVDESGRAYRAAEIEQDTFYTAFPEGADKEDLGSSLVVVRLPPGDLRLPSGQARYAAGGIVAYSKICTHAGCAISLYRTPLFDPEEPGPALVCPCHYSTFDPASGGTVIGGPAGRKLPMLPLYADRKGELRAAGTFDEPVGASWWGVRLRRPIT
jgi:ubiquinol-cytochrome c reductase iron-sulfur subunit